MAQTGKVSINSDTLNRVSSKLSSSASSLESDVGSKLPGKFQGLATLGLYSNGLTKIKEQVDFIVDTAKNLASEVSFTSVIISLDIGGTIRLIICKSLILKKIWLSFLLLKFYLLIQ